MTSFPASLSVPAFSTVDWLPGLGSIPLGETRLVFDRSRPAGRHIRLERTERPFASVDGHRLEIGVAPGHHQFALALVTVFAAPAHTPAAAATASQALLALAARVAPRDVSVLIEGATGTGKEGLARLVHTRSPRRDKPLVAVNCAALPEAMLEATLFGHERGAFTGATNAAPGLFRAAEGGTLLLDEIAELPLALQAKLLRVVQEREVLPIGATRAEHVDVRIIAAANRDLAAEVAAGRFRADLYYRLAVFPLRTLPLAERREDIIVIAAHWLLMATTGRLCWPSPQALAQLAGHDWPGNVRELGNVLDRAMVLSDNDAITPAELVFDRRPVEIDQADALSGVRRQHEDRAISRALSEAPSRRAAAERLGISERTLRYRLAAMAAKTECPAHQSVQ